MTATPASAHVALVTCPGPRHQINRPPHHTSMHHSSGHGNHCLCVSRSVRRATLLPINRYVLPILRTLTLVEIADVPLVEPSDACEERIEHRRHMPSRAS